MNDLIEKRDERTRRRKQIKRKMDSIIGLSYHDKDKNVMSLSVDAKKLSDSTARLLDEGYIDNGFVIKKGALEKYLNGKNEYVRGWEFDGEGWTQTEVLNLTSDFVGTVNLGHMDFATMPYILGTWSRDDLKLVDTENDRKALDVALHLDEESIFVQELRRQPYDIGISAEFWVHENVNDTEALSETLGYYLPVYDEIYIFAYGLVGECGNVNSSGLELKGEPMENDKKLEDIIEVENLDDMEELGVDEIDITEDAEAEEASAEAAVEEDVTEAEEADEEEVTEEELSVEESEGEEAEVDEVIADDEDNGDEADEDTDLEEELSVVKDLTEQIQTLTKRVNELTEANAKLKKTNRKLSAKYQTELDKKAKFKETMKGLSVELLPEEEEKPKEEKMIALNKDYVQSGIGEI